MSAVTLVQQPNLVQFNVTSVVHKLNSVNSSGVGPRGLAGAPGAQGPQGPVGPSGAADATQIPVNIGGSSTDLQSAITSLSQLFFQQSGAPTVGVNSGDLWFDTTANVLKVYENSVWVTVIAQPNLEVAQIDCGWF